MNEVSEIRMQSGIGRIWEARTNKFSWAHPNGSQGSDCGSFEDAESQLQDVEFFHINGATKLCDLPDAEFATFGHVNQRAVDAGYASGKAWANDLNLWGVTLDEALEKL